MHAILLTHFISFSRFFPSMVYLSNSKFSVAVLGNLGFALVLNLYKLVTLVCPWHVRSRLLSLSRFSSDVSPSSICPSQVFLGQLRDFEVERVKDKVGQALIETLLAMTIFRQDFTIAFVTQFVVLTFAKIFHWLAQDRVDYIETTPNVTRTQHARLASFLVLLACLDYAALHLALAKTIALGVSVHLLFAFEYAVQGSTAVATLIKYGFSLLDQSLQGRWAGKSVAVFYLELALDLLHLIMYSAFFVVIFSTFGIPIHLVRDLYWTFRNFQTRVRDFLRFRRIAAHMDRRFPDATPEDMERAGHVCIVCREDLGPTSVAKRLNCSHVFHLHCLRSWLERQQNCPICRAPVLPPQEQQRRQAAQAQQQQQQQQAAPQAAAPLPQEMPAGGHRQHQQQQHRAQHGAGRQQRPPAQGRDPTRRREQEDAILAALLAQIEERRLQREAAASGAHSGPAPQAGAHQHYVQYHLPYPAAQWIPASSMAVFVPAGGLYPTQYAGQQGAEAQQAQQGAQQPHGAVPLIPVTMLVPMVIPGGSMPYGINATSTPQHQPDASGASTTPAEGAVAAATQEQMATAAAIAAAAAAAATAAVGPVAGMVPVPVPVGAYPAPFQHPHANVEAPPVSDATLHGLFDLAAQRSGNGDSATPPATGGEAATGAPEGREDGESSQPASSAAEPGAGVANEAGGSGTGSAQQGHGMGTSPAGEAGEGEGGEAEEVRRRRLQRFQANM